MAKVVLSPAAASDLDQIWLYIAERSVGNANRFLGRLERACQTLAEFPNMGRARGELGANVHTFPVGDYMVFYRPVRKGIEIARVLHGARDVGPLAED